MTSEGTERLSRPRAAPKWSLGILVSDGWAALSTDACWGDTYLEADGCDITVTHPGYAAFADEGSLVVLNDCRVKTASHTGMLCGKSKMQLHRCRIWSDRHCALIFAVMENGSQLGQLTVDSCEIQTGADMFVVKGTNAYLDIRNSKLQSDTGRIICTDANREDPMATPVVPGEPLYGIKVALSDMEIRGDIIHGDENRAMSISMRHTKIRGAIRGAVIALDKASRWFADQDSFVTIYGSFEEAQLDAAEGVTIHAFIEDRKNQEISLKSGGRLAINLDN